MISHCYSLSLGKDKLTRLIAESIKGRHIPVVMGVQNPFLG
jgi:hypothetical protein